MRTKKWTTIIIFISLVVVCGLAGNSVAATFNPASFEEKIRNLFAEKQFRDVFAAISDYEAYIVSQYKEPTFENDKYRNEMEHLSLSNPFKGWKIADMPEMKELGPLFRILFCLEAPEKSGSRLALMRISLQQAISRLVGDALSIGDAELGFLAQQFVQGFGTILNQTVETIGDYRVVIIDIAAPLQQQACFMLFCANDRTYGLFLVSSKSEDKSKLRNLVESIKFDVKIPNEGKIYRLLQKHYEGDAVEVIFKHVRDLASEEEYDAAIKQLEDLRAEVIKRMPEPRIEGNAYVNEAYNIHLRNPEKGMSFRFEPISEVPDGPKMALLVEDSSVKEEGIGLMVMDLDLLYGAQFTDAMLSSGIRPLLASVGQGGASFMGRVVSEEFTQINGRLTYKAEVHVPELIINSFVIDHGRSPVLVMMMIDSRNYEEKFQKFMRILEGIDLDYKTSKRSVSLRK